MLHRTNCEMTSFDAMCQVLWIAWAVFVITSSFHLKLYYIIYIYIIYRERERERERKREREKEKVVGIDLYMKMCV